MRSWFVIVCCVFCSLCSSAQEETDSLAVIKLIRADYKALGENNVEARKWNCTADYQLVEDGELWSFAKEIDYMNSKKGQASVRADTFHFFSVQVKGDMAFAVYDVRSTITRSGDTKHYHWLESAVLLRKQGQWKIRLIHSTKVKE